MDYEPLWCGIKPLQPTDDLLHLLRLDSWNYKVALWTLMGLVESSIKQDCNLDSSGYPSEYWMVSIRAFDYRRIEKNEEIAFDEFSEFDSIVDLNERLNEIWNSGEHLPVNPPGYYIQWAVSKGFSIPWHSWAYERGLTVVAVPDGSRGAPEIASKNFLPSNDRDHVSDKLAKMNQAAKKFWGNAVRADRGTHPDNATVAAWLVQQDFSPTLANKAATIIRPEWAPTGRKPEE